MFLANQGVFLFRFSASLEVAGFPGHRYPGKVIDFIRKYPFALCFATFFCVLAMILHPTGGSWTVQRLFLTDVVLSSERLPDILLREKVY